MIKIDETYDKVDKETTKSFEEKRELLNLEEENLKDKLKNEVTKIKDKFEENMSLIKELLRKCEQIQKGIKNLQKEEKNMIKTLSYISKVNQNQRKIDNLMNSPMKNMNIEFNKDKCIIEYKEYFFNEKKLDYFDKDENELIIFKCLQTLERLQAES